MLDSRVPLSYWTHAIRTASYLHNRTACTVHGVTPYQAMHGLTPSVDHLRVFGSPCYPYEQKRLRTDEFKVGHPMVFVGYDAHSDAYLVRDQQGKILERRTVAFDEFWNPTEPVDARITRPFDSQLIPGFGGPENDPPVADVVGPSQVVGGRPITNSASAATYFVDICCGSSSSLRYKLATDPNAHVLGIDIISPSAAMSHIPLAHRPRFRYAKLDVDHLTLDKLRQLVYSKLHVTLGSVSGVHFSPDCSTLSTASRGRGGHRGSDVVTRARDREDDELRTHRSAMFRYDEASDSFLERAECQGPHLVATSRKAVQHDRARRRVLDTLRQFVALCPTSQVICENPATGIFSRTHEVVDMLADKSANWCLHCVDYCMVTEPSLGDGPFPMKPTHLLCYNVRPNAPFPRCNGSCPHRLPAPHDSHHRLLICNRTSKLDAQEVVTVHADRSRIPLGLFRILDQQRMCPHVMTTESTPLRSAPMSSSDRQYYHDSVIRTTGKQPCKVEGQHIRARLVDIAGKTLSQLLQSNYHYRTSKRKHNGVMKAYKWTDFKWDLQQGYITVSDGPCKPKQQTVAAARAEILTSFAAGQTGGDPDPVTRRDAQRSPDWDAWRAAEVEELKALWDLGCFEFVTRGEARRRGMKVLLHNKLVYKRKPTRLKGRLVVCGTAEAKSALDSSSVCRMESVRMLCAIHASSTCAIELIDVCNAFICAPMPTDRPVFTTMPKAMDLGFLNSANIPTPAGCKSATWTDEMRDSHVLQCHRGIYGLRRSPKLWQDHLTQYLLDEGFERLEADPCVFKRGLLYVAAYVDDLAAFCAEPQLVKQFMARIQTRFKCRYYGACTNFLGCNVHRSSDTITLSQEDYIQSLSDRYLDGSDHPTVIPMSELPRPRADAEERADGSAYRSIVGALLYASTCTRPDVAQSVAALTRHFSDPSHAHMRAARRVLAYLVATKTRGVTYRGGASRQISGYSDASWASEPGRKSTSGYVFMMAGAAISWCSKQQSTVALSSSESEYVALSWSSREAIWLQRLRRCMLPDAVAAQHTVTMFEDNTAAALWAQDSHSHQRSKHIDISHHFIRDLVRSGLLQVVYIPTKKQLADCLTKPLAADLFRPLTSAVMGECALALCAADLSPTNVAHCPATHLRSKTAA